MNNVRAAVADSLPYLHGPRPPAHDGEHRDTLLISLMKGFFSVCPLTPSSHRQASWGLACGSRSPSEWLTAQAQISELQRNPRTLTGCEERGCKSEPGPRRPARHRLSAIARGYGRTMRRDGGEKGFVLAPDGLAVTPGLNPEAVIVGARLYFGRGNKSHQED
ncbi:hypothetical protein AAFF_G00390350 [Aldrovandia affinis]|uniref:Uncharacterized protein n=1 Tax=Aldrovandia affinis TaxID=143900 RepID=A0AAD7SEL6_9TELE|nr:hypothetical protein AAFF_G00390350 [Aldrovandia affinis]